MLFSIDIKDGEVRHISIPHYDGINMKMMMGFLGNYQEILDYAPEACECFRLPRYWVGNLGFTIVGKAFGDFIKKRIEARNQKVAVKKDLFIAMDNAVAAAFQASTAVSSK